MRRAATLLLFTIFFIAGCQQRLEKPVTSSPASTTNSASCPLPVMTRIQHYISAQDELGHGPDTGTQEWVASIEHKLKRQGTANLPPAGTLAWCDSVLQLMNVKPTFSCSGKLNATLAAVCESPSLAALDVWLEDTYMNALQRVDVSQKATLKAMQRGWIKSRDECWKEASLTMCTHSRYVERISELQADYSLIPPMAQAQLRCSEGNTYTAKFFATPLSSMTITRDTDPILLWQVMAASGTRYEGANTLYWEHQGSAQFISGAGEKAQTCKVESLTDA